MSDSDQPSVEFSTDVDYFNNFLGGLNAVRDEGKLFATEDMVFSKVVDPANAMMCVARIKGRALNGLTVENGDEVVMGIDFEKMQSLFKGVSSKSEMVFQYPVLENGSNNVHLDIVDEDIVFNKSALAANTVPDAPQDDPLKHPTRIVVSGTDLKKAINHAEKMLDPEEGTVVFGTEDDVFYIKTSDKVEGSFKKKFRQSGPSDGSGLGDHETEVSYSFMDHIKKPLSKSDEVTVHIKDKNPIRFDVDLDDEGDAQIVYLIAPRKEDA
jgi:hypothetical protein